MRCQVCDYGDGPSVYASGLEDRKTARRVRYNKDTGEAVCDHCLMESKIEWEDEEETTEEVLDIRN